MRSRVLHHEIASGRPPILSRVDTTELWLIRHAESTWNAAGRWQGQADPPLSERGRGQARELAARLVGESLDVLVCSDLVRAHETALLVSEALGLSPEPNSQWRELDVGSWAGLRREEIQERDAECLRRFESGDPNVRPGGGETRAEIRVRVAAAAQQLVARVPGGRVALVVHLGVIRALLPGSEADHASVTTASWGEIREATRRRDSEL